jgi:uncharacterized protein YdeI (YjbR/CyaY-like superfamily)
LYTSRENSGDQPLSKQSTKATGQMQWQWQCQYGPPSSDLTSEYQQMNKINPKVDGYIAKAKKWQEELKKLRTIILGCQLTEELKWGKPCYTFQKSNIVLIIGFKEYCALLFCKGALLKDADGILITPGENTQAARQIRFNNVRDIVEMEPILKAYIHQAIEVEKAGLEVDYKKRQTSFFLKNFKIN